tara:strand:+ start:223 stop:519 length:297 start_codon:yes stop_codon:yes gene_type:complete
MKNSKQLEIEAATFRRIVQHFRENPEVQNIDLMELAGFCRNCISKWYSTSSQENGLELDYNEARKLVYGMPYEEWKKKYQIEQTKERLKKVESKIHNH